MPAAVEHIGALTLYLGDCRDIAPTLTGVQAIVTDPPYGTGFDYTKRRRNRTTPLARLQPHTPLWTQNIIGDDQPFDPTPWLQSPQVILWGAQHYASRLPNSGAWLIWDKRVGGASDDFGDGELAWTNLPDRTRIFHHLWRGVCRAGADNAAHGPKLHPAQKPIELIRWCVEKTTGLVLDPYAGSCTTGLACLQLGRPFIGIEIEPHYFEIGCQRLYEASRQLQLFGPGPSAPTRPDPCPQPTLLVG